MRHREADSIRYKITIPIVFLLSIMSGYLFHTIIIENKNFNDTREKLTDLKLNASYIYSSNSGSGYDLHRFKTLSEELLSYPEDNRFYKIIHHENNGFFASTQEFMTAASHKDTMAIEESLKKLEGSIAAIMNELETDFREDAGNKIKTEYGLLILICILLVLHHFWVDKPMREELLRNAREKEISKSTIRKLAERDTLTNLPGRMKFYEESEGEVSTATRYGSDLALVKIDIHDFKTINHEHGQKAGDKILATFSRIVRKNLRRPDSFFRVGGDKFIVLAPHTNEKNALNLAEKIRKILRTNKSLMAIPFRINIGIALCGAGETSQSLLEKVDKALEHSKKEGAGTVYVHPDVVEAVRPEDV